MDSRISAEQMEIYKRTARSRLQSEKALIEERRTRAWELARKAADLLRQDFHVSQVLVFGSLIQEGRFHLSSDVDLAVWGLNSGNWLRAMSAAHELSDDISLSTADQS